MATNPYFQHFQHAGQQRLVEDLIVESIKTYGYDVKYLPRNIQNIDYVFGEDPTSMFDVAYDVEVYIKNIEGFGGQGKFLSNIGLEVRDQITFTIAKRRFEQSVTPSLMAEDGFNIVTEDTNMYLAGDSNKIEIETTDYSVDYQRPREGDLIYFPMVDKIFEIKYTDYEAMFYQFGKLQVYNLECELFEYSSERFNTDVAVIDDIESLFNQDYGNYTVLMENSDNFQLEDGGLLTDEEASVESKDAQANNSLYENEVEDIVDWSDKSPLIRGNEFDRW